MIGKGASACVGVLALAMLTGCVSVAEPQSLEPSPLVPEQWSVAESGSLDPAIASYWTQLGDPLVSEYAERAIANNRDLAAAAARVAQARAGVNAARAGYLPQVNADGGVQRDVGDFASDDVRFSIDGTARWEIDLFGRIGYDVAANRQQLNAAGFALADLQRLIVGQVVQTTVSARALAVQLRIARETLAVQDDNLQIADWRLQAGLTSSLDVEQARAQRAQTAATIPALERDLAASANTISTLIGEAPGPVRIALADSAAIPLPPAGPGYPSPAEVLRNRPDVRRAEANVLVDGARAGLARAQLLPLVQLTGTLGTSAGGGVDPFDIISGGIIGSLRQLIFDGGRTRAQIRGAEAQVEVSAATWEQTILLALEDVETATVALQAARRRVELFAQAQEASENAAILARSQYQAGLIDFQTLLVAEDRLLATRNAQAASEAERANAFVRLTQALGGGWQADAVADAASAPLRGSPE